MGDWKPFYVDTNAAWGQITDFVLWQNLVDDYAAFCRCGRGHAVERLLDANVASPEKVESLPHSYMVPTETPSFGYRREHIGGEFTLRTWAETNGMLPHLLPAKEGRLCA